MQKGNGHQRPNRRKAFDYVLGQFEGTSRIDERTIDFPPYGICHFAAYTQQQGAMISTPNSADGTFGGAEWHKRDNLAMFRDRGDGRCVLYVSPIAPLFDNQTIGHHGVRWADVERLAVFRQEFKTAKPFAATDENLLNYALAPAMRWLIATALAGAKTTYGDVKQHLETEAGFSTIFATRIGLVAGGLMEKLQEADPKAPLINVLVVSQKDGMPSEGAGPFMARRFKNPLLKSDTYKARFPDKWREYVERAASEAYLYSPKQWERLYQKAFGRPLEGGQIQEELEKRQDGNEEGFGAGANKYGAGGEGAYHKALRLWVMENPKLVGRGYASARSDTEFPLDSGDRVDVVYHLKDRTVVLEVKSRISNDIDLRRGVFQCIKYRAVKAAMDLRGEDAVQAVLVTETDPPGDITALLRQHGIRHFKAPLER